MFYIFIISNIYLICYRYRKREKDRGETDRQRGRERERARERAREKEREAETETERSMTTLRSQEHSQKIIPCHCDFFFRNIEQVQMTAVTLSFDREFPGSVIS